MKTRLLTVNPHDPDPALLADAAQVIRGGGLVAFPTETVYGLGADATSEAAVDRIFAAKNRPASDPIIVHIAALDMLASVAVDIPDLAFDLARSFWAGALTLVLKRHPNIPPNVSAGRATVAVRMPNHRVALGLIAAADRPIAAPSANTFSRPSATHAGHVLDDLNGRIELILDGGSTLIGVESTVLDLTGEPVVLRHGGVTIEQLRVIIPTLQAHSQYLQMEESADAPGQLIKHYSPRAELCVFAGESAAVLLRVRAESAERSAHGERVGILVTESERAETTDLDAEIIVLGADLMTIAANLFAALRELDRRGVNVILARLIEGEGLGAAIRDRLVRAANGQVITID